MPLLAEPTSALGLIGAAIPLASTQPEQHPAKYQVRPGTAYRIGRNFGLGVRSSTIDKMLSLRLCGIGKKMGVEEVAVPAVRSYGPEDVRGWEDLVARACNGTFLHTRRFISYHGDRFRDRSLVLENRRERIVGVFPAAEAPADPEMIISHPGLTYGGVVHDGSVRGASMIGALDAIASHYRSLGYQRLRYKVAPSIYQTPPAEDDLYALFRLGARRHQCDLSVAVDVTGRGRVSQRRRRSQRRADSEGVRVQENWDEIVGFWRILEQNLANRHGTSPVHSVAEIQILHERFPDAILLITAKIGADLVGGTLLFLSSPVLRMQYTATTEQGPMALP